MSAPQTRRTPGPAFTLACVVLLALNLRPTAVSVGPVLSLIRTDLGLGPAGAGLLTTLPVLAFAFVGVITPACAARLGMHATTVIGLALLVAGIGLRVVLPSAAGFMATTVVALTGMAIGNVLLPSLVRHHFPNRIGFATAWYSVSLGVGLTLASLLTAPIAEVSSWRWALGSWVVIAALAFVFWLPLLRGASTRRRPDAAHPAITIAQVARTRLGWQMALFFGVQSVLAYAIFGWLPTIFVDAGLSPAMAGLMLAIATGAGLPIAFWLPRHVATSRRPVLVTSAIPLIGLAGVLGLILAPARTPWAWALCLTVGLSLFPVYLALVGLRARTAAGTAALSGFSQGVGYLLAALGPFLMGVLNAATGGWTVPLIGMAALFPLAWLLNLAALRPRMIEDELAQA